MTSSLAAIASQEPQLVEPTKDIGITAKENAGIVFGKSAESGNGSALGRLTGGQAKWSGVIPRLNNIFTLANAAALKRILYSLPRYCTVSMWRSAAWRRRRRFACLYASVPMILDVHVA